MPFKKVSSSLTWPRDVQNVLVFRSPDQQEAFLEVFPWIEPVLVKPFHCTGGCFLVPPPCLFAFHSQPRCNKAHYTVLILNK